MLSLKTKTNKNIQFKGGKQDQRFKIMFKIVSDVMFGAEAWSEGEIQRNAESFEEEEVQFYFA